jgi:pyrroline-5-carboxylate reductase
VNHTYLVEFSLAKNPKIAFIGPGVMAEAMIAGLIRKGLSIGKDMLVAGPRVERGELLSKQYGVTFSLDNSVAASGADVLVLAVKPQQLGKVLKGIMSTVSNHALILSIVAGARIDRLAKDLQNAAVVRAMPNTPARIGAGITVWTASKGTSEVQRKLAESILGALGDTIYVEDENFLDKATALSGTGPAYVYLFMEAMVDAGVHLGFPRRTAEHLVVQTLRGSVEFYDQNDEGPRHLSRLRNQVTSPGGTAAEALYFLEKAGFRTAISRAIWAAYQRSLELGKDKESGT